MESVNNFGNLKQTKTYHIRGFSWVKLVLTIQVRFILRAVSECRTQPPITYYSWRRSRTSIWRKRVISCCNTKPLHCCDSQCLQLEKYCLFYMEIKKFEISPERDKFWNRWLIILICHNLLLKGFLSPRLTSVSCHSYNKYQARLF